MEGRHHRDAFVLAPLAAQPGDRRLLAQERLSGELAERDDHLRLHRAELPLEERLAGEQFVGLGIAVVRRAALDGVADVDVLALHAHRLDHLRQQLPCLAHERVALQVLVLARPFADEHQARLGIAHAEYEVGAARVQLAAPRRYRFDPRVEMGQRVVSRQAARQLYSRQRRSG